MNRKRLAAVLAGTLDPFHEGHNWTVKAFLNNVPNSCLYIVIGANEDKEGKQTFSIKERIFLIEQTIPKKYKKRIRIVPYSKIIANYLYEQDIQLFVKGARDERDFKDEAWIAKVNSMFSGNPETFIILQTNPLLVNASSSNLKNFTRWYMDAKHFAHFAPAITREALQMKLNGQLLVGAIGGMGSGKTTVASEIQRISEENGENEKIPIRHISLDNLGKIIYSNDPTPKFLKIRKLVAKRFEKEAIRKFGKGASLLNKDTSIDAYKLGVIAFSSNGILKELTNMVIEPILFLLQKKLEGSGEGIFIIEGANMVEQNLTHLVNENIILFEISKATQEERLRAKDYSQEQIDRRIGFQLSNEERLEIIKEKQKHEKHRLMIRVNTDKKVDAIKLYNRLQEEYITRHEIIR